MATREELMVALRNADAAGDVGGRTAHCRYGGIDQG